MASKKNGDNSPKGDTSGPQIPASPGDLKARQLPREALGASESLLHSILDQSPYPMWIADAQGTLIWLNQACRDLLHLNGDEVVGKYNVFQDNIVEQQGLTPLVRRVFEKGETVRFELSYDTSQLKNLPLKTAASVILDVTVSPIRDDRGRITNAVFQHVDMTERKRAETALAESEQRFKTFMDHLPAAVFIKDQAGRLLFANRHLQELFGWEDCLGKTTEELLPPEYAARMVADDRRALAAGSLVSQEEITDVQGREHFFDTYKFPVVSEGEPVLLGGIAVDVTARKRAEDAVQQSERRFRALIENSADAIVLFGKDGETLYGSPSSTRVLGYDLPELRRRKAFSLVHPEDLPAFTALFADILQHPGETRSITARVMHRDGSWRYLEANLTNLLADPGVEAIVNNYRDVTERKHTEEALKKEKLFTEAILDSLPGTFFLLDSQGKHLRTNTSGLEASGYSLEEICQMHALDFIADEDKPAAERALAEVFANGKTSLEAQHLAKDGRKTPFLFTAKKFIIDDMPYVLGTGVDITALKEAEKALQESEERFRRLSAAAFEAIIIHEKGIILGANDQFFEMFGYEPEELLGKQAMPLTVAPEAIESMRKNIAAGSLEAYESIGLKKDGTKFPMEIRVREMEYEGRKVRVAAVMDITARRRAEEALRESEERYRSLFQNNHAVMLLVDPETGAIMDANPAACTFYGYSQEELLTKTTTDLNTLTPDQVFRAMQKAKAEKQKHFQFQHRLASGEVRDVEVFSGPIRIKGQDLLYSIIHDVTARKKAQEALRESEKRLKEAQELAHLGFWYWNVKTGEVTWSDEVYKIFQLDPQEFTPTIDSILELSPWPGERGRDQDLIRKAMDSPEQGTYEQRFLRPDKSIGYYYSTFQGKYDTEGNLLSIVGTVLDITERKKAEEALRESETKYRHLYQDFQGILDTIPDTVCLLSPDLTILWANQVPAIRQGMPNISEIGKHCYPQRHGRSEPCDDCPVLKCFKSGKMETEIHSAHGKFWELRAFPIYDDHGELRGGLEVARDITERKRMEEALRESQALYHDLVETAQDLIWQCDSEGRYTYLNPAWEEVFGYKIEEMLGKHFADFQPPDYAARDQQEHYRLLKGNIVKGLETVHLAKDGRELHLVFNAKVVRDKDGNISGTRGTAYNITERKMAEEALRQSEKKYRSLYQEFQGILNTIPDILCLISPDLRIIWGNEATALALPDSQLPDVIGKHCYPLRHERPEPCENCPVLRCFSSGKMETEEMVSFGDIYELRAVPLYDDQGELRGAIEVARNITEKKQAEERLLVIQERLELALKGADLGTWDWNVETGEILVNQRWAEMLGYTLAEVEPHLHFWEKLVHPDDLPGVMKNLNAHLEGQTTSYETEQRLRHKLGNWVWVLDKGKVIERDAQGKAVRACGTHLDITERKRAEEVLRISEVTYREIFNTVSETIWVHDIETFEFIDINNNVMEMLGYSVKEAMALNVEDISSGVPPFIEETAVEFLRKAAAGEPQVFEWHCKHKDGHLFWSEVHLKRGTIAGKDVILALERDITERKQAEQALRESEARFRQVVEHSPLPIAIVSGGQGEYLNPKFVETLGYTLEDLPRMADWFRLAYPDPDYRQEIMDKWEKALAEAIDGDKIIQSLEVQVACKDGSVRIMEIWGVLVGPKVIFFCTDLTDRKRAEEERARLEAQMREVQKLESLGVLAGGIAHDFNNLLMAILGNADLALLALSAASPARPHVEAITRGSLRAADLCRQMLAYSGKGRFVIGRYNLSEIVQEMTRMLKVSVSKKANLRYSFAADLPAVEVDVTQMRQVIMNLIINASESLGDRNGFISVATGVMDCDRPYLSESYLDDNLPEGRYVFLEVADTGCGMDDDTRRRIFDPFFTTKFTGRGLGLAAVLGIVRGHQGAIKVYSEPGQGTTFKVLLPAVDWAPGELEASAPAGRQPLQGGTILLVDDDSHVRQVVTEMLERLGFAVLTAANGREGLEVFKTNSDKITCVLLDLTMPEMAGDEMFRELRRLRKDVPVILSSGFNEQEVTQRFAGKGVAGFIQKPYTVRTLQEALSKTLGPAN
ncbi:MAG: PAS domain S-box protein [Thermodesulfobacteriota bacterium]